MNKKLAAAALVAASYGAGAAAAQITKPSTAIQALAKQEPRQVQPKPTNVGIKR